MARNAGKVFRLHQIKADPTNGFLWAKPNKHTDIQDKDTTGAWHAQRVAELQRLEANLDEYYGTVSDKLL
jgi:hypothetical protein